MKRNLMSELQQGSRSTFLESHAPCAAVRSSPVKLGDVKPPMICSARREACHGFFDSNLLKAFSGAAA
jgi:hypothetical protein